MKKNYLKNFDNILLYEKRLNTYLKPKEDNLKLKETKIALLTNLDKN